MVKVGKKTARRRYKQNIKVTFLTYWAYRSVAIHHNTRIRVKGYSNPLISLES
jgi:hypothetical protein